MKRVPVEAILVRRHKPPVRTLPRIGHRVAMTCHGHVLREQWALPSVGHSLVCSLTVLFSFEKTHERERRAMTMGTSLRHNGGRRTRVFQHGNRLEAAGTDRA